MKFDFGTTLLVGLQCGYGSHVAADTVADDGEIFTVHLDFVTMFSYPLRRSVNFIDGLWITGIRRARVIDKDTGKAGKNDEVTHHTLVRRVIAQHPAAPVYEDENRKSAFDALRPHDVEFDRVAISSDRFLRLVDA